MHHVFVSYSRSDSEWVTDLVSRLEAAGHAIWLDQRDIPLTLPWFDDVRDAIAAADLFLVCDSPASRESANCGAELDLARGEGKRQLALTVGSDPALAAAAVSRTMVALDPELRLRTELAVLARDWDKGGQQRNTLPSRKTWKRLAAACVDPPPRGVERDFLRASRRRSRRRTLVSVLVGLTIVVGALIAALSNEVVEQSDQINSRQARAYTATAGKLAALTEDPYARRQIAGELGGHESATDASVLEAAFAIEVPDRAFPVAAGTRRLASIELGSATTGGAALSGPAPDAGLGLRHEPHSGVVEVWRDGVLWRRIVFSQSPAVLRLSPDGRELAAGGGSLLEVADLEQGSVRSRFGGAGRPIRDLAWSRDGSRLWALGNGLVTSWKARDGAVLLNRSDEQYEALLPAADPASVWAVSRDGLLREVDVGSGSVTTRLRIPDEILSGGGAGDGSVAALSGEQGLWIVPLAGGDPSLMRIPGCTLGRAVFMDPRTVFLPCLNGKLLRISVPERRVEKRIFVGPSGVFATRPMPRHGVLLASDPFAGLYAVRPDGDVQLLSTATCDGSITRIGISRNEQVVAPVGSGTGLLGCPGRGVLTGEDPSQISNWQFIPVLDDVASPSAGASAVSDDGALFAYGYDDGTVIVHPTGNILPVQEYSTVVGEIRDMYVTPDDRLLVATRSGVIQRIPLCERCLSNRAMARLARSQIERGLKMGTAVNLYDGAHSSEGAEAPK